jgi:hypothetical protein
VTRRRRQFSPEFKEKAVRMVLEGERTVASVAREFGIKASTLWCHPARALVAWSMGGFLLCGDHVGDRRW